MHLVKIAVDYSSASIIHPKLTDLIRDPVLESEHDRPDLARLKPRRQPRVRTAIAHCCKHCKQPARMAYKGQLFVFLRKVKVTLHQCWAKLFATARLRIRWYTFVVFFWEWSPARAIPEGSSRYGQRVPWPSRDVLASRAYLRPVRGARNRQRARTHSPGLSARAAYRRYSSQSSRAQLQWR